MKRHKRLHRFRAQELCRRGGRKIIRVRRDEGTRSSKLSESTKQGTYEFTETEAASTGCVGLHQVL